MKTWQEVLNRLKAELGQWYIKQCQNNFATYYLYYRPTTEKADGGFLFCEEKPKNPNYLLGWSQPVNKGATINQNFRIFSEILRTLPIMSY